MSTSIPTSSAAAATRHQAALLSGSPPLAIALSHTLRTSFPEQPC